MKVVYTRAANRMLDKLDAQVRSRIVEYMNGIEALSNPRSEGKPLKGNRKGSWRYRIGNYRVICDIVDKEMIITVVKIGHRSDVYREETW